MSAVFIVITIAVGVVCCVGILSYGEYKTKELVYKNEQEKNITLLTESGTELEIERERTKQLTIKAEYREKHSHDIPERDFDLEIEKEKTKQLEIKERYYKEHGERLYV